MTLTDFAAWHTFHCSNFEKKNCARTQKRLPKDMSSADCRSCFYNHFILKADEESISLTDPSIFPSGAIPQVFFTESSSDIDVELAIHQIHTLAADIKAGLAPKKYPIGTKFAFVFPVAVCNKVIDCHIVLELVDYDNVMNLETPADHSATFRVLMRYYPLCCVRSYRGLQMVIIRRVLHMLPHELQRVIVNVTQELYDMDPPVTPSQDEEVKLLKGTSETSKKYSMYTYTHKLWVPTVEQLGVNISPYTNVDDITPEPKLDLFNPTINPTAESCRRMYVVYNEQKIPMPYWTSSLLRSPEDDSIGLGRMPKEGDQFDIVPADTNKPMTYKPIPIVPFVTIA